MIVKCPHQHNPESCEVWKSCQTLRTDYKDSIQLLYYNMLEFSWLWNRINSLETVLLKNGIPCPDEEKWPCTAQISSNKVTTATTVHPKKHPAKEEHPMTPEEIEAFISNSDEVEEAKSMTPEPVNEYIRYLQRHNYALFDIAAQKGFYDEARDYLAGHGNEPIPFEW